MMARSSFLGMDAERGELYRLARREAGVKVPVDLKGYVVASGVPGQDDADMASRRLRSALLDLMEDVTDARLSGKALQAAFFPQAADLTFQHLNGLAGDIVMSQDFWRYLALYHLYEVVDWMHPSDNGDRWGTNPSQFNRCMPLSLFVRGQIAAGLQAEERGAIDAVNDIDVWTSHVVAVLYGTSPVLVSEYMRVLATWQDEKSGKFNEVTRLQLRQLAKLLTAARSNTVFDLADVASCRALVERLAKVAIKKVEEERAAKGSTSA